MSIVSGGFLLLIGIVAVIYWLFPDRKRWWVLLAASIFFYAVSSWQTCVFIILSIISIYVIGIQIEKNLRECQIAIEKAKQENLSRDERKGIQNIYQKKNYRMLMLVVLLNIGILAVLKYTNFVIQMVGIAIPQIADVKVSFLIPLGISYYTFQAIGYIVDVYRGIIPAEKNLAKVILYVSFFPAIMQGPFNRYEKLMPEFEKGHVISWKRLTFGLQLMLWGYFKKLVIADRAAILVDSVFSNYALYDGFYYVVAILFFAVYLYADFSGYMDIMIGYCEVLDIELPQNFRAPFFARNLSEFWQRWHITLGTWLKDYVFYPLLKSKWLVDFGKKIQNIVGKKWARSITTYIGMVILWFSIGLWHGGDFKYVFSVGLLQCIVIICGEVFEPITKKATLMLKVNTECFSWHLFQALRTTAIMCFAWIFFYAESFSVACEIVKKTVSYFNPWILVDGYSLYNLGINRQEFWLVVACAAILLLVDAAHEKGIELRESIAKQNIVFRWTIYLLIVFMIIMFGEYGITGSATRFLYMQF